MAEGAVLDAWQSAAGLCVLAFDVDKAREVFGSDPGVTVIESVWGKPQIDEVERLAPTLPGFVSVGGEIRRDGQYVVVVQVRGHQEQSLLAVYPWLRSDLVRVEPA